MASRHLINGFMSLCIDIQIINHKNKLEFFSAV